ATLPRLSGAWDRVIAVESRPWFYRLALERGYLDALLSDWVVYPVLLLFRMCGRLERRWIELLNGPVSHVSGSKDTGSTDKVSKGPDSPEPPSIEADSDGFNSSEPFAATDSIRPTGHSLEQLP